MSVSRLIPLVAGVLVLALGCRQPPKGSGFREVRSEVADRTGFVPRADRESADGGSPRESVAKEWLAGELTAEGAVRVALVRNPDLQALYEGLAVRRADVVQAGLPPNPILDAEVKFLEEGNGDVLELAIVQPILDLLMIPLRRRTAAAEFRVAKVRVTREVLAVVGRTRRTHYELRGARQSEELLRSAVDALRGSARTAKALYDVGNVAELEWRREQALYEESRQALARAQLSVERGRAELDLLMGTWGEETAWDVPARLPEPSGEELDPAATERRAVARSLEIAAARAEIDATARRLGLRRVGSLLREGGSGVAAEREPDETWAVGPAFELELPVWDFGQASVPRARAEMRRAILEWTAAAVRVRSRVRSAVLAVDSTRRRVRHYRETVLPLRQRVLEQTLRQYNAMQIGTFDVLAAKRQQLEAALGYVETLRRHWVARARLDQILSGALPGGSGLVESPPGMVGGPSGGEGGH